MIEPIVDERPFLTRKRFVALKRLAIVKPGSREERELDALATLVDAYKRRQRSFKR